MTLVTLSAAYGAGGSRIGPALAERLGVPFIDRAIPMGVAERLEVSVAAADAHDARIGSTWIERVLSAFVASDSSTPAVVPAEVVTDDSFRRATEEILLRQAEHGEGVILGRMAMVLMREHPSVLRVRLHGPAERRIEQAIRLQLLDWPTAERGLRSADRMHDAYAKHFYGVDLSDASLYHLVIDSTAIPIDACVDLIARAAESLSAAPRN
jgi:cytidylate kinase